MRDLSSEIAAIQASFKILPNPEQRLRTWLERNRITYPPNSSANRILWLLDDEQVMRLGRALQRAIMEEQENAS